MLCICLVSCLFKLEHYTCLKYFNFLCIFAISLDCDEYYLWFFFYLKGTFMVKFCSENYQTICSPCTEWSYSDKYNIFDRCEPCQTCQQGNNQLEHWWSWRLKIDTLWLEFLFIYFVSLKVMIRSVQKPQREPVLVTLVSCALTASAQFVRRTNASKEKT